MADCGAQDVFIAYPIIGENKLTRLANLAKRVKVSVAVDDFFAASQMGRCVETWRVALPAWTSLKEGLT